VPVEVLLSNFHLCCACVSATADVGGAADNTVPGLYVCGWLKRGPTGIIGTNLTDAEETVASMAQDYAAITQAPEAAPGRAGLQQLLEGRGVHVVNYAAWEQLNAFEVSQGQQQGSVRVKCASWHDLLGAAGVRVQQAAGR
jgi:adrenodoxin-NADP+ reductase